MANHPGVGTALIVLLAAMPEPRGGGDLESGQEKVIGRWAGDKVVLIGDYAENGDIKACNPDFKGRVNESLIYGKRHAETKEVVEDKERKGQRCAFRRGDKFVYFDVVKPAEYTDISDLVAKVIEHELNGKYEGDGWRQFKSNERT